MIGTTYRLAVAVGNFPRRGFVLFIFSILCFILPIIAIILGAIAYFGKAKDTYGLIGFILGMCLIVSAPVGIAATTYVRGSGMMGPDIEMAPSITFAKIDQSKTNTLTVTGYGPTMMKWEDILLKIDSATRNHYMSGTVKIRDTIDITSIAGTGGYTVLIIYKPSNSEICKFGFTAAG